MFFRNLTIFRFDPVALAAAFQPQERAQNGSFELLPSPFEEGARDMLAKPVGPLEFFSSGFVSPFGHGMSALTSTINGFIWFCIGGETKVLPPAVVNAEVQRRLDEVEDREGTKPGGRARRRIRDEVLQDLLPVAFVRPWRVNAYLDPARGLLVVDTASARQADAVAKEVRRALGSFPAVPLNAEVAPRSVLTGWLAGDALPEGLAIGDEAELRDPVSDGAKARLSRQELQCEEVTKHLESGKQCTRLALTLNGQVSFVLGDDLVVRKVKLLDGAVEGLEETEREGQYAELDARFALMTGELVAVWELVEAAFQITKPGA